METEGCGMTFAEQVLCAPLLCVLASYAVPVSLYGKLWTTPLLVLVPRKVTAATILKNVRG